MRIAALYDIHGNLPALEAVLEESRRNRVDQIVIGGDIVPGPFPRETLERLLELEIPKQFIHGNCEIAVLQQMAGEKVTMVPEQVWPIIEWTAQQFDEQQRKIFSSWPKTMRIDAAVSSQSGASQRDVLFCHGTPRSENEIFTRLTSDERLKSIFDGTDAGVVVCGHTHMQFDRMLGNLRIVNAGSVGMPFGERGAHWLLLDSQIHFRRTEYDYEAAAARIRASGYPQAEQFVTTYVLNSPSEQQMLEVFRKAEKR